MKTMAMLVLLGGMASCLDKFPQVPPTPPSPSAPIPSAPPVEPSPCPVASPCPVCPTPTPEPVPTATPTPTPTPEPTAPPEPHDKTDVVALLVLDYGGPCKQQGIRFDYRAGCGEALVTATPKQGTSGRKPNGSPCAVGNCDSQNHGRDLHWYVGEACNLQPAPCVELLQGHTTDVGDALLTVRGEELFNLVIEPKRRGTFHLWGVLHEPQGTFFQDRVVTIR